MECDTVCLTAPKAWVRKWLHWDGRRAAWHYCRSRRTDSPFIQMREEVGNKYRLSAMLGRLQGFFRRGHRA